MTQQYIQIVTPYGIELVFVQKIAFILRKINKAAVFTPIRTKSFVG